MPKIPDYPAHTAPDDNDELIIEDSIASSTKKITRGDFLAGSPLPADTVDTQAIDDGAVTPAKRSGGFFGKTHVFDNATGTQTITGLGFKPKGLIVIGNADATTSTISVCTAFAFDTGSGTVQGGQFGVMSESGPSAGSISSTGNCFVRSDASGSASFAASVTSWDADGITVNVGTSSATAAFRTYHVLFFG